jgi:hypothetical protein
VSIRLIQSDWEHALRDAMRLGEPSVFACPFIKHSVVKRLIEDVDLDGSRVVTRFSLPDFARSQ